MVENLDDQRLIVGSFANPEKLYWESNCKWYFLYGRQLRGQYKNQRLRAGRTSDDDRKMTKRKAG